MRSPQVSDRIKEAPAQALRGVFAGIGQLLLITDKLRNKAPADVARARTPEAAQTSTVSAPADQREGEAASPAAASPVAASPTTASPTAASPVAASPVAASPVAASPATAEAVAAEAVAEPVQAEAPVTPQPRDFDKTGNVRLIDEEAETAVAAAEPVAVPEPVSVAEPASVAQPVSAVAAAEAVGASPAPLANYGELSVASLRARLRNLDVTQVRQLADYERAHEARAGVIAMFERRIAKLEAEA
jgi:hypothetical protein